MSLLSATLDFNYISAELGLDISTESLSSQNLNSTIQKFSTVLDSNYISTELELDIDTESSSSQNLSSTIQKFSTSLKRRRIDVDVEAHDNYGFRKHGDFLDFSGDITILHVAFYLSYLPSTTVAQCCIRIFPSNQIRITLTSFVYGIMTTETDQRTNVC
ncbi:hypothetical protein RhiirA5_375385 [Rhizophagus irregularis]|uniref:Uncharacterized protein n=1 Tax=Rhizophagus irregularis TaxID=588596 RepID=A0A2N0PRU6_9GLOM|nr:hypothetical protein RhiirA5_375385 [Rhizophagus irregularis]